MNNVHIGGLTGIISNRWAGINIHMAGGMALHKAHAVGAVIPVPAVRKRMGDVEEW